MNNGITGHLNPVTLARNLIRHRYLIGQLTRRDLLLKYRGSYLGIGWSFLYPLLLLTAFTFVFERIFGSRWPQPAGAELPFALIIYCGLIVFNLFSEVAGAAPRLIHGYQNYVKKIVFPVEILPVTLLATACIHAAINILILVAAVTAFGQLHPTVLLLPLVLLPLFLFALGVSWLLAAAGVFIRDLTHVMPVFLQVLLFLSPVFYPISMVPDFLHWFYQASPLSGAIEDLRRIALWGQMPDWSGWSRTLLIGIVAAFAGHAIFQHGKEEFADVL